MNTEKLKDVIWNVFRYNALQRRNLSIDEGSKFAEVKENGYICACEDIVEYIKEMQNEE